MGDVVMLSPLSSVINYAFTWCAYFTAVDKRSNEDSGALFFLCIHIFVAG